MDVVMLVRAMAREVRRGSPTSWAFPRDVMRVVASERPRTMRGLLGMAGMAGHVAAARALVAVVPPWTDSVARVRIESFAALHADVAAFVALLRPEACAVVRLVLVGDTARALALLHGGFPGPVGCCPRLEEQYDPWRLLRAARQFRGDTLPHSMRGVAVVLAQGFGRDVSSVVWAFVARRDWWAPPAVTRKE